MSTNSVRPLRRYRAVLILTAALLVVSCKSTKQTTVESSETQISSSYWQTLDSIAREAINRELLRLTEQTADVTTELLLFDTEKPADSLTGLPPVKAALRQQAATKTTAREEAAEHVERENQAHAELTGTDSLKGHWEADTKTVTSTSASKWADGLWYTLGVFAGLLLICVIIYLVIILKK